jgi:phospholipid-binding lipoprotein MlaA
VAAAPNGTVDFTAFEDEFDLDSEHRVFDPLAPYNRFMFKVNDKIYLWVLKPVATGYGKVVPESGRIAARKCLDNLGFPGRLVNNLLQFKIKSAGVETARFAVNSTVGVLGLFDPAKSKFGLEPQPEDVGQTFGRYGVGEGFPIVLPLFGPSNLRDAIGRIGDHFLDPVSYLDPLEARLAVRAYDQVNYESLHLGEYEKLVEGALDPYLLIRDAYKQNRDSKIQE